MADQAVPTTLADHRLQRLTAFNTLKEQLRTCQSNADAQTILGKLFNSMNSSFASTVTLVAQGRENELKALEQSNTSLIEKNNELSGSVMELQGQLMAIEAEAIQRPVTSDSLASIGTTSTGRLIRGSLSDHRASMASKHPLPPQFHMTELITEQHAKDLIDARKLPGQHGPDGTCWESASVASHVNGYKSVNLENTVSRVDADADAGGAPRKIGVKNMYLYHLALIADGRRDELNWVQKDTGIQISHLCHNGGCFAPDHLVAEEAAKNRHRNACQGHSIIDYTGDGRLEYHPCVHAGDQNEYRRCILPVREIKKKGRWSAKAVEPKLPIWKD